MTSVVCTTVLPPMPATREPGSTIVPSVSMSTMSQLAARSRGGMGALDLLAAEVPEMDFAHPNRDFGHVGALGQIADWLVFEPSKARYQVVEPIAAIRPAGRKAPESIVFARRARLRRCGLRRPAVRAGRRRTLRWTDRQAAHRSSRRDLRSAPRSPAAGGRDRGRP